MLAQKPFALPCGIVLPNRLCKAAMAEVMAPKGIPGKEFPKAYSSWAEGNWGMILTGNVQVSRTHLGQPGDPIVPRPTVTEELAAWRTYAEAAQRNGTPTFVQIAHPGRQSMRAAGEKGFFEPAIGPSSVTLNWGDTLLAKALVKLLYGTPRALTVEEIEGKGGIIEAFVETAKQSKEAGFQGVELHAAHGYLLAGFLSPKTNLRTDAFGGTPAKRAEIVVRIVRAIKETLGTDFGVGIKLNSVDVSSSATTSPGSNSESLSDTLEQIALIVAAGIDFIEVSGGSYEDPKMMDVREVAPEDRAAMTRAEGMRETSWRREIFFIEFAETMRARFPSIPLMLTGGFRSRTGIEAALQSGACDLVGIGRPAAVLPKLPAEIVFNQAVQDEDARFDLPPVKVPWLVKQLPIKGVGAGMESMHYASQIQKMGRGETPDDNRIKV